MKRNEFTLKLQKFIDAPFALGDTAKGWDCLNSLAAFYDSIDRPFPRQYKEFNELNYAEKWKAGEGRKELREFLLSLGEPINPNYALEGDLFIFEGEEMTFPAIYLGRGHLLTVWDKGVKVTALKAIRSLFKLVDTRRI